MHFLLIKLCNNIEIFCVKLKKKNIIKFRRSWRLKSGRNQVYLKLLKFFQVGVLEGEFCIKGNKIFKNTEAFFSNSDNMNQNN